MLQAVARQAAAIRLPLDQAAGVSVVAAFLWLLFQDRIPPLAIYLLDLYLTL